MTDAAWTVDYIVAIQPTTEAERVLCDLVATTDLRAAPESVKRRIAAVLKAPSPGCLR